MKASVRRVGQSFAILLVIAFMLCSTAFAISSNAKFTDVPQWCADSVNWAVEQSITNGTTATTFSPDILCTNAQVLTFLWRACGSPDAAMENPFTDISPGSYFYKAALWAYQNNMVIGNQFEPDKPCTRSMAVVYLWQFAGYPEASARANFDDVNDKADYAPAVAWAVEAGVTNGTSSTQFSPNNTCTRVEIVTFLYRARDILDRADDTGILEDAGGSGALSPILPGDSADNVGDLEII